MKKWLIFLIMCMLGSISLHAQKFAYVDTKYILENIPEYQQALNSLDELSLQWQKELEQKYAEIDKLYKAYQNEAFLLTDEMKKKRQDEIINKEKEAKELQKKYFGAEGELFKKRQELIKPIQDKVYDAIEKLATEGNYAIIFDRAGSTTVIYANEKFDKSDEVLQRLGYKK